MASKIAPQESIDFIDDDDAPMWPKDMVFMVDSSGYRKIEFKLTAAEKLFLTFENPRSSLIARVVSVILLLSILLATLVYIMKTDPSIKKQPNTCPHPVCKRDPVLCPGIEVCEPIPPDHLMHIESVCVVIFAIDYFIRMFLVAFVNPRLSGVYNYEEFDLIHENDKGTVQDPFVSRLSRIGIYAVKFSNIIDLASIIPHFIVVLLGGGESMSFLRVFQLGRILRAGKNNHGIEILTRTIRSSQTELAMLLFFILLGVVVSASLVYTFEKGDFEVTHAYPEGEYLRATVDMTGKAPTPYVSIWASMYWSLVTATTLGYGDMYPTTPEGRFVSSIWIICGILVIGLPIGVIGSRFSEEIQRAKELEQQKEKHRQSFRQASFRPAIAKTGGTPNQSDPINTEKKIVMDDCNSVWPLARDLSTMSHDEKVERLLWLVEQTHLVQKSIQEDMTTAFQ